MGLSFHYSGSFRQSASLPEMIEELTDIAEIHNWKYHIFQKQFPLAESDNDANKNAIYGIMFSPPRCEPVWLCFLANRRLCSPINLELFGQSEDPKHRSFLYILSTRTQYAGTETHMAVINLLRYLAGRYFEGLEVSDEGNYWETGDVKILEANFRYYNDAPNVLTSAYGLRKKLPHESYVDFLRRILKKK